MWAALPRTGLIGFGARQRSGELAVDSSAIKACGLLVLMTIERKMFERVERIYDSVLSSWRLQNGPCLRALRVVYCARAGVNLSAQTFIVLFSHNKYHVQSLTDGA